MAILEKTDDESFRKVNRLGYYLGSFDPLHNGHIEIVKLVLSQNLCDAVLVYCVRGHSSYKRRSDFLERTRQCESIFGNKDNVFISYLPISEIQNKITTRCNNNVIPKFKGMKISAIIGADIALELETVSKNPALEKSRLMRQQDFMRGHIINDETDSVCCAIAIPADDFIVALRSAYSASDIPQIICGRKTRAIVDTNKFRNVSSSRIKSEDLDISLK